MSAEPIVFGEPATVAMTMTGVVHLPACKAVVWEKLHDPEVLKRCLPGCRLLTQTSQASFAAAGLLTLGPFSATVRGHITFKQIGASDAYRIAGTGSGGFVTHARAGAVIRLADAGAGTVLSYDVEADVGGRVARIGRLLIAGVAKRTADAFFARFATAVAA